MSEEKQLTVAELLARRAAERGSSGDDTPRRPRRRRSIEEGGISVAELTGSIPRVDRKPAESRHSSVPIDPEDGAHKDKVPAEKLVKEAEATSTKEPSRTPESEAATPKKAAVNKQESSAAPAAEKREKKEEKPSAPVAPVAKPEAKPEAKPASPSVEDTAQLRPIKEAEGQDAEATATLPKVDTADKPAAVAEKLKQKPRVKVAEQVPAAVAVPEVDDKPLPELREEDYDLDDDADAASGSIFSVILLAIVGIVLGVVIFIGFDLLWDHFNRKIVAALAVAVTAAMIGVIHAMRTARDGLSMLLAGLVGLLMTFGPLVIKLV